MKLLITGSSGLLGLNLALHASRTHDVIGVDRNRLGLVPFTAVQVDLLEQTTVARVLEEHRPGALIHCAAAADVDFCEKNPKLARRLNAEVPRWIAHVCAERGIRLLHISTDAVFDGLRRGPYSESDVPNPRGVYATTKLEGETAVLAANPTAVIARVNFYGWSPSGRRSLAEFFVNNLSAGKAVDGFVDVHFCPLLVDDLADILLRIIGSELRGLYHAVGPRPITKHQFGVEIAREFGWDENLVHPQSVDDSGLTARRSHNLWLSSAKLSTGLGLVLPDFSTGLHRFHSQYELGYPQKIRSYQQLESPPEPGAQAGRSLSLRQGE
jgi:dTDP-4-dehydrorhamnose reductase